MNGAEILTSMLKIYGVEFIFGVPGDTGTLFYEALYHEQKSIKHIMARQERSAGFMADVYARITGKTGVCEGPSGGGATYLIPAVAEAQGSSTPLIALTTDVGLDEKNKNTLTDLNQFALYKPVTKWNTVITSAEDIPAIMRKAFTQAHIGRPGAVHVSIPKNVLREEQESKKIIQEIYREKIKLKEENYKNEIEDFIQLLDESSYPVVLAGGGILISNAEHYLNDFIEFTGVPSATTLTGKGSIPEEHPLSLGVFGGNGGRDYANNYIRSADLVIILGCKTGSVSTLNQTLIRDKAKIIQVDIDPEEVGRNYDITLGITGDLKIFLKQLNHYLKNEIDKKDWENSLLVNKIAEDRKKWFASFIEHDTGKIHPSMFVRTIQKLLPDDSILIIDPGTATPYVGACYSQKTSGRKIIFPRAHGGLGYGIPGAIAAKLAKPDNPVFTFIGDGGAGFCISELETAVRLNVPAVFIVFNNSGYGWIKTIQHLYHDRHYFSVDFNPLDYSRIAQSFGVRAIRIEKPDELEPTLKKAIDTKEPFLIDMVIEELHTDIPPVHFWKEAVYRKKMKNGKTFLT